MLNRVRTTSISVRVKLFASAGLLLVLMAVIGVLAIMNLSSVNSKAGSMYRDRAVPLAQLGTVEASLVDEQRINLRRILVGDKDPAIQTELDAEIVADEKAIADEFGAYKATLLLPAEEAEIAQFDPAYASYQALRDEVADLARAGSAQEATAKNLEALDVYKASIAALGELKKINVDEAARLAKEIESTYSSARLLTLIVLIIAIVLGSAVSFLITRGILKTIKGLIGMSEAVAAGDLTVRADADRKDEFGRLSQAINAMVESLAGLVGRIGGVSQALLASSEQMAATSEQTGKAVDEIAHAVGDVASGAERQVRMVESARSSVDEVVSAVKASADSAKETAEAAGQARSVAEEGVSAAALASQAMGAVRDSTEAVTAAIRELGQKSEEIGGIVETITGIAGQTNLLALNAAIEAARAGEQGRGFAVVADEVRKLAEESQQAAASIAGLIGEIQSETQKVVSVVEDGAKRTEDGALVVEQTREAFLRIGTAVDEMTARVEQIAGASLQVASGAARVQEDMNEVAAVAEQSSAATEQVSASTEQTTASAQEIAASAQELARTAEELGELVGQFTV